MRGFFLNFNSTKLDKDFIKSSCLFFFNCRGDKEDFTFRVKDFSNSILSFLSFLIFSSTDCSV